MTQSKGRVTIRVADKQDFRLKNLAAMTAMGLVDRDGTLNGDIVELAGEGAPSYRLYYERGLLRPGKSTFIGVDFNAGIIRSLRKMEYPKGCASWVEMELGDYLDSPTPKNIACVVADTMSTPESMLENTRGEITLAKLFAFCTKQVELRSKPVGLILTVARRNSFAYGYKAWVESRVRCAAKMWDEYKLHSNATPMLVVRLVFRVNGRVVALSSMPYDDPYRGGRTPRRSSAKLTTDTLKKFFLANPSKSFSSSDIAQEFDISVRNAATCIAWLSHRHADFRRLSNGAYAFQAPESKPSTTLEVATAQNRSTNQPARQLSPSHETWRRVGLNPVRRTLSLRRAFGYYSTPVSFVSHWTCKDLPQGFVRHDDAILFTGDKTHPRQFPASGTRRAESLLLISSRRGCTIDEIGLATGKTRNFLRAASHLYVEEDGCVYSPFTREELEEVYSRKEELSPSDVKEQFPEFFDAFEAPKEGGGSVVMDNSKFWTLLRRAEMLETELFKLKHPDGVDGSTCTFVVLWGEFDKPTKLVICTTSSLHELWALATKHGEPNLARWRVMSDFTVVLDWSSDTILEFSEVDTWTSWHVFLDKDADPDPATDRMKFVRWKASNREVTNADSAIRS